VLFELEGVEGLVKDYPQSRYVADAYLSFAEYFFAKGEMSSALRFYEKVAEFPKASVLGFALYKRAWAQINLGDFKAALGSFVTLIGLCQAGRIDKAQRGPLEKEARKDLVKAYARLPGASADKAWEFFQRVGKDEAPRMLLSLAELYWEQGMPADSSRVYRRIMANQPRAQNLCGWQVKVLRNTLSVGTEPEQVQELGRLGSTYRYLQQLPEVKPDVLAQCRHDYHDTARELAFVLHKQAQRLKRQSTYQLAAAVYRQFLDAFESEKASVEVAFFFAECLWQIATLSPASESNRWSETAEQYTRVIHLDPAGQYVKEAAYAAVLAWQNALYLNDDDLGDPRQRASSS
jgi:tetratricopeptide (TPR) repeat protein